MKDIYDKLCFKSDTIFNELTVDELSFFYENVEYKHIKKREEIYNEDHFNSGIYLIETGSVFLSNTNLIGEPNIFNIHKKSDIFGYRSLFCKTHHSEIATANEDSIILHLSIENVKKMMALNGEFKRSIMNAINRENIILIERMNLLSNCNIKVKIIYFLLLFDFIKKEYNIDLPIRRADFANLIGTVRESFIRSLKELKNNGLITMGSNTIRIIDYENLTKLIHENH
ncbi:Crp/Fnr family transcriptional regulator [Flammeovirga yaeyamensis]|uniref:Crp/Fnr family transcriptional regulator n=1 Tax=Flammeovirga yaeyamensis TaxID=367791 RepID=A0AAX1NE41_9BACT|nr:MULTISPECIES: Crp/Fnr family transcriptional regulator [Flammeovirga]ANQ52301.1 Crp/Fnr family transcriptional regulator [Flammeovirga sp. MY04]MBB3700086.1 CRP-like cAMP-binding protein [Flammeovirga yaeyamensis]NMF37479.1 Crp/Fnr family transcriptional regulator [Flammeovirga yaeyamensis]QWG04537.1 Crp/Fnr family transcriptional regulator [Flammeovirga yaeyamensis]